MILKEAGEMVLEYIEEFKDGGDLHYATFFFWHNSFDLADQGKLDIVWDDELCMYVGKIAFLFSEVLNSEFAINLS